MPYLTERYFRTVEQTLMRIQEKMYTPYAKLSMTCYATEEPVDFSHKTEGKKLILNEGDKWGNNVFDCGWFLFEGVIPEECKDKKTVMLIDVSGEGLIYDDNGEPVQGITYVNSQFDHSLATPGKWIYPWSEKGVPGEKVSFWMDGACNDLFGNMRNDARVKMARIGVCDEAMIKLYFDMVVLYDYLKCSDPKTARYKQILFTLYEGCCKKDYTELAAAAERLVSMKGGDTPLKFTAIGHAHMDLAWLWPIRETKRKGARTFSTAINLMDRYPDYHFGASQPQLFQWMKEEYPGLYRKIKEKVAEGRIEVQGCMWVEADTNVSGGEALVRQILYGKTFFKEEFGKDVKVLWLPDVFGYNAALPQILKKSGNEVFMTQKLSWSQHNKFPHQSFRWKGIDGTEIFTHMLPAETYNSPFLPRSLRFAEENYFDSGICDEALILFGIGDGGGGPGMEHLEAAKRLKNFYGLCSSEQAEAQTMLLRLRDKVFDKVPTWHGELYLERHQGTYTTSAKNKWYNRKMELALRELEYMCILSGKRFKEELDAIWKEVLLYQFHDILPGSSIQRVYDESRARYAILYDKVNALIEECRKSLSAKKTYFNSLSWDRDVIYESDGKFYRLTIPAMGCTSEMGEEITPNVCVNDSSIENSFIKATFNATGALVSCIDKRSGRETLSSPSNKYAVYTEYNADCWDIAIEYTDRAPDYFKLEKQSFFVEGAKAVCRQHYVFNESSIDVDIHLDEGCEYLTFDTTVNWLEQDVMLRTSFDTAIVTDKAGFDIQYGMIHRSNNDNTLWDKAQFEVCGHKFVDLSENNWGVSLLNDCKYGFRVKDSVMDMDILRAQHYPSDLTDKGIQHLSYALYPHIGNEKAGKVKEKAYEFNIPAGCCEGNATGVTASFAKAENVIVEAIKPAEDGNGIILRVYEPYGTHADMKIDLNAEYRITPCDLMENSIGDSFTSRSIRDLVKPFEILTYRLEK